MDSRRGVHSLLLALVAASMAFLSASGTRPEFATSALHVDELTNGSSVLSAPRLHDSRHAGTVAGKRPSLRDIAVHMPVWARHAVAWPLSMHPGVSASLLVADAAVSLLEPALADDAASASVAEVAVQNPVHPEQWAHKAENVASGAASWWELVVIEWRDGTGVLEFEVNLMIVVFLAVGISVILFFASIVFACLHKGAVTNNRPPFPEHVGNDISMAEAPHDFNVSLFGCCTPNMSTCLYAFCCPLVRHADTLSSAGVMSYWLVFVTFVVIELGSLVIVVMVDPHTPSFLRMEDQIALLRVAMCAAVFLPKRQALRQKFGSPHKTGILFDLVAWTCCIPCTIAQEGREVDFAQGVEVGCPCRLQHMKVGDVVGDPVSESSDVDDIAS